MDKDIFKFPVGDYKSFNELPLGLFDTFRYSVYILDFKWNYLFVNNFVKANLGSRGSNLFGKNMWEEFPELGRDAQFVRMRQEVEKGKHTNFTLISPITNKRLHVIGHPLSDCYYFSSSILPDKEDLLNELRTQLGKPIISR